MKKYLSGLMVKARRFGGKAWTSIWRVGKEDPRRAIHALKVGLSLTLVSLLYLMEPFFKGIGSNAVWAVMTVVVVLEFTAGQSFITPTSLLLSSQTLYHCPLLLFYYFHHKHSYHFLYIYLIIGSTWCKGFNRGLGTLVAGSLVFLMDFIATEYGKTFGAIFISAAVFVIGNYISSHFSLVLWLSYYISFFSLLIILIMFLLSM